MKKIYPKSFVTWDSIRFGSNAHDNVILSYHSYSDYNLAQKFCYLLTTSVLKHLANKFCNSLLQAPTGSIFPRRT